MAQNALADLVAGETSLGTDMQAWLGTLTQPELKVYQGVVTWKALQKLRQTEKAMHFLAERSDSAASLPSEVRRHFAANYCCGC